MRFKLYLFLILIVISCQKENKSSKVAINTYEIVYSNHHFVKLILFDNNDTLYFTQDPYKKVNEYAKIKAKKKHIELIKEIIIKDIQSENLLIDRDYTTDSGHLKLKITNNRNEISSFRTGVDKDLKVSHNFSQLLHLLEDNYNDVYINFVK